MPKHPKRAKELRRLRQAVENNTAVIAQNTLVMIRLRETLQRLSPRP